jgi:hypothetical protein
VLTVTRRQYKVEVRRVRITNGRGGLAGGVANLGQLRLTDCVVTDNEAPGIGGLFNNNGARLTLVRCTVANNRATSDLFRFRGGVYNEGGLSMTDCTVSGNQGGGVGSSGSEKHSAGATLTGCTITGNQARFGGGVSHHGWFGETTLRNTTVARNVASEQGGGIYFWAAQVHLIDSVVTDNEANVADPTSGGGVYFHSGPGRLKMENSRVTGNRPNNCTGVVCPA